MKLYLAGPMTGYADFNYPLFRSEAARLRGIGHEVEDPSDNPEQEDWADYLRVALRQMLTCDAVAVLPSWQGSRGARLEVYVAKQIGMSIFEAKSMEELRAAEIDA